MHGGHGYWVIWRRCVEFEPDTENRPVILMRDCLSIQSACIMVFFPSWLEPKQYNITFSTNETLTAWTD